MFTPLFYFFLKGKFWRIRLILLKLLDKQPKSNYFSNTVFIKQELGGK